jgi:hypothetical protein
MILGSFQQRTGDPTMRLGYVSEEAARRDHGWDP